MIYLSQFILPSEIDEDCVIGEIKETCYNTFYPFGMLTNRGISDIRFGNITILYGGNGSGKTTMLNIIAEKMRLDRGTLFNRSDFFDRYIEICDVQLEKDIPHGSCIITSDDVFDYMLDLRCLNDKIDHKRGEIFDEYIENKYDSDFRFRSMDDLEKLKAINRSRSLTKSQYTRRRLVSNVREHSNGESAFLFFSDKITDNKLILLDEPENSLSPEKQCELCDFLIDSARFFGCQFIIATHSPFLLAMHGAVIYDLDSKPVCVKKWTELPGVRAYYSFFEKHSDEFK